MPWYAAHAIVYFELTDGSQDRFQVYENVFLVRADTTDEGFAKARAIASRDEGDDSGSLRVGDRPARRVFAGIRKLIAVSHESPDDQLGDGDEVTYSKLVVPDREALLKLVADLDVKVLYIGRQDAEPHASE
jgi:hypothetical protein